MIYFLNKTDSKRDPFWSHIIYILFVVFDLIYLLRKWGEEGDRYGSTVESDDQCARWWSVLDRRFILIGDCTCIVRAFSSITDNTYWRFKDIHVDKRN